MICPTCGHEIDDGFKEYFCKCGCGICCKADDPKADKKIESWKRQHKCHKKSVASS